MKDFEPAVPLVGAPTIPVSSGHGKVFIPQTMVWLAEHINVVVGGGGGGGGGKATLEKEKATLAKVLGP